MKKPLLLLAFLILNFTNLNAQKISENLKKAYEKNDVELFKKEIKEQKLDINVCYQLKENTYSLLSLGIKVGSIEIVNELLKEKVDVNKICENKTPLMYAVKYGQKEIVVRLLESGANIDLENSDGKTALDYAKKYEQNEIAEILKNYQNKK